MRTRRRPSVSSVARSARAGPHRAETDAQAQQVQPCEEPADQHLTSRVTGVTSRRDGAA